MKIESVKTRLGNPVLSHSRKWSGSSHANLKHIPFRIMAIAGAKAAGFPFFLEAADPSAELFCLRARLGDAGDGKTEFPIGILPDFNRSRGLRFLPGLPPKAMNNQLHAWNRKNDMIVVGVDNLHRSYSTIKVRHSLHILNEQNDTCHQTVCHKISPLGHAACELRSICSIFRKIAICPA